MGPTAVSSTVAPSMKRSRLNGALSECGLPRRERVRISPARGRCRLEPAVAPSTVEEEVLHRRLADDRRAIEAHVRHARPGAQHPEARERRHDRHRLCNRAFDHCWLAAPGVAGPIVRIAAHHDTALVGLADVAMQRLRHDHRLHHRLHAFGDDSLQGLRFNRELEACKARDLPAVPCDAYAGTACQNAAARGLDTDHLAAIAHEAVHFTLLDDVYAQRIRRAGIAPGHRIVARGDRRAAGCSAPSIGKRALRERSSSGSMLGDLRRGEQFGIDPVAAHGIGAAFGELDHVAIVVAKEHQPRAG